MKEIYKTRLRRTGLILLILGIIFLADNATKLPTYICFDTLYLFIVFGFVSCLGIIIYFKTRGENV